MPSVSRSIVAKNNYSLPASVKQKYNSDNQRIYNNDSIPDSNLTYFWQDEATRYGSPVPAGGYQPYIFGISGDGTKAYFGDWGGAPVGDEWLRITQVNLTTPYKLEQGSWATGGGFEFTYQWTKDTTNGTNMNYTYDAGGCILFNATGTQMNIIMQGNPYNCGAIEYVFRFNLSTPWELSTATYLDEFALTFRLFGLTQDDQGRRGDFQFGDNGTKLFFADTGHICSIPLGTPYDLSTLPVLDDSDRRIILNSDWLSLSPHTATYYTTSARRNGSIQIAGTGYNTTGTKFYFVEGTGYQINSNQQLTVMSMSTPYDWSTATVDSVINVQDYSTAIGADYVLQAKAIQINDAGTVMLSAGAGRVSQLTTSVPWNFSSGNITATATWFTTLDTQYLTYGGTRISPDGKRVYAFRRRATTGGEVRPCQFTLTTPYNISAGVSEAYVSGWHINSGDSSNLLNLRDSPAYWPEGNGSSGTNSFDAYAAESWFFSSTGTTFYRTHYYCHGFWKATLTTPWDMTTLVQSSWEHARGIDNAKYNMNLLGQFQYGDNNSGSKGFTISPDGNWLEGPTEERRQYDTTVTGPPHPTSSLNGKRISYVRYPLSTQNDPMSVEYNATTNPQITTLCVITDAYEPALAITTDGKYFISGMQGWAYQSYEVYLRITQNRDYAYRVIGELATPWDITSAITNQTDPDDSGLPLIASRFKVEHHGIGHLLQIDEPLWEGTYYGSYFADYSPYSTICVGDYYYNNGGYNGFSFGVKFPDNNPVKYGFGTSTRNRPKHFLSFRKLMKDVKTTAWDTFVNPSNIHYTGVRPGNPYWISSYQFDYDYIGANQLLGFSDDGTKMMAIYQGVLISLDLAAPYDIRQNTVTRTGYKEISGILPNDTNPVNPYSNGGTMQAENTTAANSNCISPDGTKVYIVTRDSRILQLEFSVGFDVSTYTGYSVFDTYNVIGRSQASAIYGFRIRGDGQYLYINRFLESGSANELQGTEWNNGIYSPYSSSNSNTPSYWVEIFLSTPWDVSTGNVINSPTEGHSTLANGASYTAMCASHNGEYIYRLGPSGFHRWNTSGTRWNFGSGGLTLSGTYSGYSTASLTNITCMMFSDDGTKFYVVDWDNGLFKYWSLGTAWAPNINWSTPTATAAIPGASTASAAGKEIRAACWSYDGQFMYWPQWDATNSRWYIQKSYFLAGNWLVSGSINAANKIEFGSLSTTYRPTGTGTSIVRWMQSDFCDPGSGNGAGWIKPYHRLGKGPITAKNVPENKHARIFMGMCDTLSGGSIAKHWIVNDPDCITPFGNQGFVSGSFTPSNFQVLYNQLTGYSQASTGPSTFGIPSSADGCIVFAAHPNAYDNTVGNYGMIDVQYVSYGNNLVYCSNFDNTSAWHLGVDPIVGGGGGVLGTNFDYNSVKYTPCTNRLLRVPVGGGFTTGEKLYGTDNIVVNMYTNPVFEKDSAEQQSTTILAYRYMEMEDLPHSFPSGRKAFDFTTMYDHYYGTQWGSWSTFYDFLKTPYLINNTYDIRNTRLIRNQLNRNPDYTANWWGNSFPAQSYNYEILVKYLPDNKHIIVGRFAPESDADFVIAKITLGED